MSPRLCRAASSLKNKQFNKYRQLYQMTLSIWTWQMARLSTRQRRRCPKHQLTVSSELVVRRTKTEETLDSQALGSWMAETNTTRISQSWWMMNKCTRRSSRKRHSVVWSTCSQMLTPERDQCCWLSRTSKPSLHQFWMTWSTIWSYTEVLLISLIST